MERRLLKPDFIDYQKPEIYTYTFPEHLVFSGTANGSSQGAPIYYPGEENLTPADAMNRVFLMGYRFDLWARNRQDPFAQYMKDLIGLRKAIKGELYRSHFRDEIGLGPRPDRVEAKVFRHVEGTSLTVTLIDRRQTKEAFTLTVDLGKHGVGNVENGDLYTFEGTRKIEVEKSPEGLTLRVPPREHQVAAIIID